MEIEVSVGEIVDKATILEIKLEEIKDENKLFFIKKEYLYLKDIIENKIGLSFNSEEFKDLKEINKRLWVIEDDIRDKERNSLFDSEFIELARSVYKTNDLRASLKLSINLKYKSNFVEVKSYSEY
jgi:hypothetical protein